MTEDEIKKLAWSAAEEMYKGYKEMNIALMEEEFKMLISFILKEHCIVKKEKVLKLHQHWADRILHTSSTRQMYRSRQIGAEEIFGKEMFEEDKK